MSQGEARAAQKKSLRVLDLFSGIGGFSLGLERAGMQTVAFCEIEPFPRAVLRKHWPNVPCYKDIRTLTAERLASDGIAADVICGGFPCQDISVAGKGAGIEGERSGLWSEYARLIGELRPRYVIVENVAALLGRGISRVLGDLSEIGYDAEWQVISAADVGAPHRRERVWIVAYPRHAGICERGQHSDACQESGFPCGVYSNGLSGSTDEEEQVLADASQLQRNGSTIYTGSDSQGRATVPESGNGGSIGVVSDANIPRLEGQREISGRIESQLNNLGDNRWWGLEPNVGRVAHGVSSRVDRLKGLGNAVVPQIPEIIARAIIAAEAQCAI